MQGQPLCIAIALGMLIATVTTPPWQDHLITFSQDPQFHLIEGATLAERVRSFKAMNWESNTDFDRVFDHILQRAQRHNVRANDMPRALFVLSDMQFDQVDPTMTTTAFERIDAKYAAAGYSRPQMVFWNLRASSGVPVTVTTQGTALVSGFSGNLLKLFLGGQDFQDWDMVERAAEYALVRQSPTPMDIMRKAIDAERFAGLKVVD